MTIVLLRWALVSTLAMAAVLALRGLTKNRISFRTRYVLWLLPLLRMLVPLFPGASAASAANLAPRWKGRRPCIPGPPQLLPQPNPPPFSPGFPSCGRRASPSRFFACWPAICFSKAV